MMVREEEMYIYFFSGEQFQFIFSCANGGFFGCTMLQYLRYNLPTSLASPHHF
jgi:hypothetical protein